MGISDPGLKIHYESGEPVSLNDMEPFIKSYYHSFPDYTHQIEDVFAADDKAVVRVTFSGTHINDFSGTNVDQSTLYMQKFIGRLTEIFEANLQNEHFGVKELAREMGMSRLTLHRKITEVAKLPANQFICQIRLEKAIEMLRETTFTVSETAYECGFHSVTYFLKCFHDFYGVSPGEIRKGLKAELTAGAAILEIAAPENFIKKRKILLLVSIVVLLATSAFLFMKQNGKNKL